jgi:hypothetical protein
MRMIRIAKASVRYRKTPAPAADPELPVAFL